MAFTGLCQKARKARKASTLGALRFLAGRRTIVTPRQLAFPNYYYYYYRQLSMVS